MGVLVYTSEKVAFKMLFASELITVRTLLNSYGLSELIAEEFVIELLLYVLNSSMTSGRSLEVVLGEYIEDSLEVDHHGNFIPNDSIDMGSLYRDLLAILKNILVKVTPFSPYFADATVLDVKFGYDGSCLIITEPFSGII